MSEGESDQESGSQSKRGTIRIEQVDVGRPPGELKPLKVIYFPRDLPYPPDQWLNLDAARGQWGFLKEDEETLHRMETIVSEIERLLDHNLVIVMPEFAGSQRLTCRLQQLVGDAKKQSCFIIAGSYYVQESGSIASKCPVILPSGKVVYQYKFGPSHFEEKRGCSKQDGQPLYVFRNTGIGNFAVVICSDGMPRSDPLNPLRHPLRREEVRQLFVPARNPSSRLPNQLNELATEEGIVIYYCNGQRPVTKDDSRAYVPLRTWEVQDNPRAKALEVDLKDIFSRYPEEGRTRQGNAPGFAPRPVLWSGRSPIMFRHHMKVLAIGSHFDDVWLGCAATLMLLKENFGAQVVYRDLCDIYPSPYFGFLNLRYEAATLFRAIGNLCKEVGFTDVRYDCGAEEALGDQEFHVHRRALEAHVDSLYQGYQDADLVFVPRGDDYHQDHVLTAQEVLRKFRDATIFEYEIKEFRRAPFHPSVVIDVGGKSRSRIMWRNGADAPIDLSFAEKKAHILGNIFPDMLRATLPSSFSREHVLGRMLFRAQEGGLTNAIGPAYAESFASDHVIR